MSWPFPFIFKIPNTPVFNRQRRNGLICVPYQFSSSLIFALKYLYSLYLSKESPAHPCVLSAAMTEKEIRQNTIPKTLKPSAAFRTISSLLDRRFVEEATRDRDPSTLVTAAVSSRFDRFTTTIASSCSDRTAEGQAPPRSAFGSSRTTDGDSGTSSRSDCSSIGGGGGGIGGRRERTSMIDGWAALEGGIFADGRFSGGPLCRGTSGGGTRLVVSMRDWVGILLFTLDILGLLCSGSWRGRGGEEGLGGVEEETRERTYRHVREKAYSSRAPKVKEHACMYECTWAARAGSGLDLKFRPV